MQKLKNCAQNFSFKSQILHLRGNTACDPCAPAGFSNNSLASLAVLVHLRLLQVLAVPRIVFLHITSPTSGSFLQTKLAVIAKLSLPLL